MVLEKNQAQNTIYGLYSGNCGGKFEGYICQQFLLEENGEFKFYDLLHLAGWSISEGNWQLRGDTLILNSFNPLNRPQYSISGESKSDSLNIFVYSDRGPLPYVNVVIDTNVSVTDTTGATKISKEIGSPIFFSFVGYLSEKIQLTKSKFTHADTLKVKLFQGLNAGTLFIDKKWLVKNDKIFHTHNSEYDYDSLGYFIKVPMSEFRYSEDY